MRRNDTFDLVNICIEAFQFLAACNFSCAVQVRRACDFNNSDRIASKYVTSSEVSDMLSQLARRYFELLVNSLSPMRRESIVKAQRFPVCLVHPERSYLDRLSSGMIEQLKHILLGGLNQDGRQDDSTF